VQTYTLEQEDLQNPRFSPAKILVFSIGIIFALNIAGRRLWTSPHSRESIPRTIADGVIDVGAFAFVWLWDEEKRRGKKYKLIVDEDQMSHRFVTSKSVRRGKVMTVIERRRGLLVSEHGQFGTHWFGGVWIPKQLPEYESLKLLAISWKSPSAD
jgi:hypothetical protein